MSIKNKIFAYFSSREDLRVLFVFDGLGMLLSEIEDDSTPWPDDYVFYHFQGDWFTTKVRLSAEWKDKKVVLLFNQIEPSGTDDCLSFPLMSTLLANMVFHEEDAIAFMQQRGIPMQYADFFTRHIGELLRDRYDKILSPYYSPSSFTIDLAHRGMLSAYLGSSRMLEWYQIIAQIIILSAQDDESKMLSFWSKMGSRTNGSDVKMALSVRLVELTGCSFDELTGLCMTRIAETLKYNAITQQLSVSEADPYKQLKIDNTLQLQQINSLLQSICDNNKLNKDFFTALDSLAANIREDKLVEVYGADAMFCHIPENMAGIIADHIARQYLHSNPAHISTRLSSFASSEQYSSLFKSKIDFLMHVGHFYEAMSSVGTVKLNTPDLYISKYLDHFYRLDMYYRFALTSYADLGVESQSGSLEEIKAQIDRDYASVTNEFNLEWVRCLKEFGSSFQCITSIERQADFFKNHIGTTPKLKTAVIVSDAFRYEMAKELLDQLSGKKHVATLTPALAMLPTETKYTKAALLPHTKLSYCDAQMEVDGKVLATTEQRTDQLNQYVEGGLCINYDQLMSRDKSERREIFKHRLVYIFHNTLDENCHGCSLKTFTSASRDALAELSQLIAFIHDYANVTEIYLTSDHGFLYNDIQFAEKDKQVVSEETLEKKTRYFLSRNDGEVFGISKFPLQAVSKMAGEVMVGVPNGTNRLAKEGGDYQFAHGGASLQELIIPVLHSKYKGSNTKQRVSVSLLEPKLSIYSSRMKAHLVQGEAVSMDMQELTVNCAIYVDDLPVSPVKTITLNSTDAEMGASRIFEVDLTITQSVSTKIMQFKVFRQDDSLNPIIVKNIINNTLIEQDDF